MNKGMIIGLCTLAGIAVVTGAAALGYKFGFNASADIACLELGECDRQIAELKIRLEVERALLANEMEKNSPLTCNNGAHWDWTNDVVEDKLEGSTPEEWRSLCSNKEVEQIFEDITNGVCVTSLDYQSVHSVVKYAEAISLAVSLGYDIY